MVTTAKIESEKVEVGMNVKKDKTMVVLKQEEDVIKADIYISNETLEQISTLKYLGPTTQDGKNEYEIKIEIAIAKSRFQQKYRLFTFKKSIHDSKASIVGMRCLLCDPLWLRNLNANKSTIGQNKSM